MKRMTVGDKLLEGFFTLIVLIGILLTVVPFLNVIATSLSTPEAITQNRVWLWPVGFNVEAYNAVFRDNSMVWSLFYTIILTVIYTALALVFTLFLAYPLTKERLWGKKFFTVMVIFTMYFAGGIIPDYILIKNLHLTNTMWALVLPGMISAYNMIIMKSFLQNLPASIEESACLDGASDFRILFEIILPLSKPVLATVGLFYAVTRWNSFQDALFYITDTRLYPLQLRLNQLINITQTSELTQFEGANLTQLTTENIKSASIIFTIVPIILVYPWLQKYFVVGVTLGAVKG